MRKLIITLLLFSSYSLVFELQAASVDTVETFSVAMNKKIKAVIIKPDSYHSDSKLPVIYLLHGHGGNYANWVKSAPNIKQLSDDHQVIIVCPDGNVSSWYLDSPLNPQWRYETYVAKELVSWVDKNYKTIATTKGRAITGLSMGGHGALYLAFRNQDIFGAAGSMSGGVDIRPFPKNWGIIEKLGTITEHPENWEKHTVTNMTDLLANTRLKLLIDCGTEDFFFNVNQQFHQKLLDKKVLHDYIVRPGAHNWKYWTNAIDYQVLFMSKFFKE